MEAYPANEEEAEDFIRGLSPGMLTFGEEGAEDSGVAISSMSAYGPDFEPFLLKALLKELRSWLEKVGTQISMCNGF